MGQNNDPTERGDLQGNQGAPKGTPKSAYMKLPDNEGNNVFGQKQTDPAAPPRADGEDAPNAIPLPADGK
ncbi:MAG: hypothetical protein JSR81_08295 [Proteobacteria bacterium]|jgi:hypothetical protein|nr:hypothetical protein [Pseudomonadota bacterium]